MKKFISLILALTMTISCLNVFASSSNKNSGYPFEVLPNSPVKNAEGDFTSIVIQPREEVTSGTAIFLTAYNCSFDESFFEECAFKTKETGTTYNEIMDFQLSRDEALEKYIGGENSNELPYSFKFINSDTLMINIFPISDDKANKNNNDVTQGTPIYKIKLPIISGSELGSVMVMVDGNESSITSDTILTVATVVNEINPYLPTFPVPNGSCYSERVISIGSNQQLRYNNRPVVFCFKPRDEVEKGSILRLTIKNGTFDESMLSECAFLTESTNSTYEDIVNSGLDIYEALEQYVGNQNSRALPYKLEYISPQEIKVELFPIPDSKVNFNNSDVTQGVPVYKILMPVVTGSNEGYTVVTPKDVNGSVNIAKSEGYYTEYKVNNNIFVPKQIPANINKPIIYDNKPASVVIKPVNGVGDLFNSPINGESILIKVKNGRFDEGMLDDCAFLTEKTKLTYDYIINTQMSPVDALRIFIGDEDSRRLPYKLSIIDDTTLKVDLYPIIDTKVNINNSDITQGIPIYDILLPLEAGSETGYTEIAVEDNNSTIERGGWYTVANINTVPKPSSNGNITEGGSISAIPNTNIIKNNEGPVITYQPKCGIEEGTQVIFTIKNGAFTKELMDEYAFKTEGTLKTYDEIIAENLSVEDALIKYIGNEQSRKMPYKFEYIDSATIKATLFPLPENKAGIINFDVTQGTPVYSFVLPAVSGSEIGDVTVKLTGCNPSAPTSNDLVIAKVIDTNDIFKVSVVSSDIVSTSDRNVESPKITIKENYANAFKTGSISVKAGNGFKFDTDTTPELINGINAFFKNIKASTVTENEITFEIPKDALFSEDKTSSVIIDGVKLIGNSGFIGDANIIILGSFLSDDTDTVTVAKFLDDGSSESTSEITTEDTTSSIESTTEATETTTKRYTSSGGGGGSYRPATTTTTESTTESTTKSAEESTETTTTEIITTAFVHKNVKVTIGSDKVMVGSDSYTIDAVPYIQSATNSTMVPLRFVAVALLGENVDNADTSKLIVWNGNTKTVTITAGSKVVNITSGDNKMIVDGKKIDMANGAVAEIKNGRMYVPFRAIGNALGFDVNWDGATKTAVYDIYA